MSQRPSTTTATATTPSGTPCGYGSEAGCVGRLPGSRCEPSCRWPGAGECGAHHTAHTSLSHLSPSRWLAAAGAPLPDNYQASPQMEMQATKENSARMNIHPGKRGGLLQGRGRGQKPARTSTRSCSDGSETVALSLGGWTRSSSETGPLRMEQVRFLDGTSEDGPGPVQIPLSLEVL
ncbi:unnamed protein product [Boreogadus saida]